LKVKRLGYLYVMWWLLILIQFCLTSVSTNNLLGAELASHGKASCGDQYELHADAILSYFLRRGQLFQLKLNSFFLSRA
jgi:hypothetical protein